MIFSRVMSLIRIGGLGVLKITMFKKVAAEEESTG